ncbi:MAG: DEAD/DEAH box helicase, partial [Anaerolineae bacterium]|nr:DEAD/DEAH box helicase [Anaerolineae bacterium]
MGPTEQLRQLRAGVDVLVTTPGRLLDLYHRGAFQLRGVRQVVLDEGDRL